MELTEERLLQIINQSKAEKPAIVKLKTTYIIELFLKNKRRHVRSLERYKQIFREFIAMYPELPLTSVEVDAFLSTINVCCIIK
jgi:hypothetical protein